MKLNEDVILKIYHESLNSDLETKSCLRHACPFIYRHYFDTRFIEINHDIVILYFKYLLSKPKFKLTPFSSLFFDNNDQQHSFENFQKTFPLFQNLRLRNIDVGGFIEDFFEVILKVFKEQPNTLQELSNYIRKSNTQLSSKRNNNFPNQHLAPKFSVDKKINKREEEKNELPFRLLYNNNSSQKAILQPIMKLALEQGIQQNTTLSFEDFTFQQRMALEGLFEAFYNILQVKFCHHLHFKPNFMHLRRFELYNCHFNYTISIPFSPYLNSIKVIDSKVKLMIDGHQCPSLKSLTLDEEASLKLIGRHNSDFDQLERLQLRNINFYDTLQLPQFNHLKSFRLNNYPSTNVVLPTMNDLQELFVQDSQLTEHIYIKPQPNLKFLRLWNYHSSLSLMEEDIQYIYSNYTTINEGNTTLITANSHRFSTLSTASTSSTSSTLSSLSTNSITSSAFFPDVDSGIDYLTYFPKVEYLRIGYCCDLLFIKQISQRISTVTVKNTTNPSEKRRLRRFNLLFPNLKTLVIERSCDAIVNYLKWFIPTLPFLTTLIFKDCHWSSQETLTTTVNIEPSTPISANSNQSKYSNDSKKKECEDEEEEQDRIEELLLQSNNLQTILQKMRFPSSLVKIIFINCSKDLTEFIQKILNPRQLSIQFNDIQCNECQLKKWWVMY